jgi:tryptophanyl-tRNA synthetase
MSADILIYDGTLVPVGKDQIQHIEMAQDMATRLNETYRAELLLRPEFRLSSTPYVTGLDGKKMSTSYGNVIPIFETGKPLRKLCGRIVTDSTPLGEPLSADTCNVFALLRLFASHEELEKIRGFYATGRRDGEPFGYGHAKQLLADHIDAYFAPARARRAELLEQPELVSAALERSAARARAVARATIDRCRQACGLV